MRERITYAVTIIVVAISFYVIGYYNAKDKYEHPAPIILEDQGSTVKPEVYCDETTGVRVFLNPTDFELWPGGLNCPTTTTTVTATATSSAP